MREARVIPIINELLKEGAIVHAYDPVVMPKAKAIFKHKIHYASSAIDCLHNADCCILVTEWAEFKSLTAEDYLKHMTRAILVDGRRIYDPEKFRGKMAFSAIGLGE
jgi:UDPglucose 6-dehydrogenase